MKKVYDIVATTSTYQENGETKRRYQNVGSVYQGDKGPFIVMASWVNLAALPRQEGREGVILNLYPPKENAQQKTKPAPEPVRPQPEPGQFGQIDEEPFVMPPF